MQRIKSRGTNFFSIAGKEVMIKSIIQAIPTYAMSCFKIPKVIYEAIENECAKFWWGTDETKRKLHWKTWKFFCHSKCLGGLGFRNLELFNRALLAKQIWRILRQPNSLVSRILKARYFNHEDIMDAKLGNNPSYI